MIEVEEGVLALANQATASVLGGRIYADTLPPKCSYPAAVLHADIGGRVDSRSFETQGVQVDRYQFDFAGGKRVDVVTARDLMVQAFAELAGPLPNGVELVELQYLGPLKLPYDDDKLIFWTAVEIDVKYTR